MTNSLRVKGILTVFGEEGDLATVKGSGTMQIKCSVPPYSQIVSERSWWVHSRKSYLLGLGRFSEDKGEEAQADFLMLGGTFAYLGMRKEKTRCHSQEESS